MNLSNLHPAIGSTKVKKRKGRGPGSHLGKTGGRGHKGAGQRTGKEIGAAFEGGQMPMQRRLPKRGFVSHSPVIYQIVNIGDLEKLEGTITAEILVSNGLIKKANLPVKILGDGTLTKALTIKANKFSKSALKAIETAKGVAELI